MLVNNTKYLGEIKFGEPQYFKYELTNNSTSSVSIEKLVVSCASCTKAEIDKWELHREETANISVTFTPGALGLQSKRINVVYLEAGEEKPNIILHIKANVT